MRAKQSSTADGIGTSFAPAAHAAPGFFSGTAGAVTPTRPNPGQTHNRQLQRPTRPARPLPVDHHGEGLLHDARNLVSAIGLYCDLLSMPGVLKPEHRQYPEELRLLGTRSRVLIEHLMRSLVTQNACETLSRPDPARPDVPDQDFGVQNFASSKYADSNDRDHVRSAHDLRVPHWNASTPGPAITAPDYRSDVSTRGVARTQPGSRPVDSGPRSRPVSLRTTVERCRGLLSRVANDRAIDVIYGAAADVPVWVSEEAIERILVNLVRNASQALDRQQAEPALSHPQQDLRPRGLRTVDPVHGHHPRSAAPALDPAPIRISVGPLLDRIGETRSWPFQHVRLIVEDSGCGMKPEQLHSLLFGQMAPSRGTHGIGFRVVRDLVAGSNGDLRALSTPAIGTSIQIEWPVAATYTAENDAAPIEAKRRASAATPEHRRIPAHSHTPEVNQASTGAY